VGRVKTETEDVSKSYTQGSRTEYCSQDNIA